MSEIAKLEDREGRAACDISNGTVNPDGAVAATLPLAVLAALLTALRSQEDKPR